MNEANKDVILNNQLFVWLCEIMKEENSIDSVYWVHEKARNSISEEMIIQLMNLYEFIVISAIRKEKISTLNCTVGLIYQNCIYFLYYGAESFVCAKKELGCEITDVYLIDHETAKKEVEMEQKKKVEKIKQLVKNVK